MKTASLLVLLFSFFMSGCVYTSHQTYGNPISQLGVTNIVKGKTTKSEIKTWFGDPYMKSVSGDDGENWIYMYIDTKASAQAYTMKTNVQQENQTLNILFKNDVVVNYTFSKSSPPVSLTNQ